MTEALPKMESHLPLVLSLLLLLSPLSRAEQQQHVSEQQEQQQQASQEKDCPRRCRCTQSEIVCRNVGLEEIPDDLPVGENKYTKM